MRKLFFSLAILTFHTVVFSQQWDRHMLVKKMDISVRANAFTATTFIEMEFYNPGVTEMEGLYTFRLDTGQVITGFQLELNGQYRDGSIEEKWKARNAYNTIVGKRVDPALLQMDGENYYSLRIYPVPAKGTRKITMTINQMLVVKKEGAVYRLPLYVSDSIEVMNIDIMTEQSTAIPYIKEGLLSGRTFVPAGHGFELKCARVNEQATGLISFVLPLSLDKPHIAVKHNGNKDFFALRFLPSVSRNYDCRPADVVVFWDRSVIQGQRDIEKEIDFLQQYIITYKISGLTIISFNQQVLDTAVFLSPAGSVKELEQYLKGLTYEGATYLGSLDFSRVNADAILVFSDGINSYGKMLPRPGKKHVFCVNSSLLADKTNIDNMIGRTGGKYIDLLLTEIPMAVREAGLAENILLGVFADSTAIAMPGDWDSLKEDTLMLYGSVPKGTTSVRLVFGNNGTMHAEQIISILPEHAAVSPEIERLSMLENFSKYTRYYSNWYEALHFGKQEKIVTMSTSYIVLEKIEDYIKFQITPPKELESQCDMNYFVKVDADRRKQYKKATEAEILDAVAYGYCERVNWWKDVTRPIPVKPVEYANVGKVSPQTTSGEIKRSSNAVTEGERDNVKPLSAAEVVVTALGITRPAKELGYSVSKIRSFELTQARPVNIENGLTGKVSGLNVQTVNNSVFNDTRITLRGIRSLSGNNQPLLVLDGLPLPYDRLNRINPNDVMDVTILRSPGATAIYGPEGANGAIIVSTRKGRAYRGYYYYYGNYKLKNQEDVEYLAAFKSTGKKGKLEKYEELKQVYGNKAGFYLDMAQELYENNYRKEAIDIIYSAAEVSKGNIKVRTAIAYYLESWKEFDRAIALYEEILAADPGNLQNYRNLALAHFQRGNYQQALNIYYEGVLREEEYAWQKINWITKAMLLQEMNAVIAMHPGQVDVSHIDAELLYPVELDLRITFDCNTHDLYEKAKVIEPRDWKPSSKDQLFHGGKMTRYKQYWQYSPILFEEYQAPVAKAGIYRLRLDYWDYGYDNLPTVVKITVFKNFGKPGQTIEVENVIMDNQNGNIEIATTSWK